MQEASSTDSHVLNLQLKTLHEDVSEMKSVLKDLATAITKLALIEERQANAAAALERAFGALERVESRVSALEKDVPANKRVGVWLDRAIWAGMGLLAMTVLKKSGLG
jgi:alpha-D-ribose 1-methylphosphonate 5-triphosphate synthase subunit PhnI